MKRRILFRPFPLILLDHRSKQEVICCCLQDLEAQIDVIFPRPKPPISEAAKDSLSSDADSNKSGNQSSDDEKKDGG